MTQHNDSDVCHVPMADNTVSRTAPSGLCTPLAFLVAVAAHG